MIARDPFAYRDREAVTEAVAGRGKSMTRVQCVACREPAGEVFDTIHGALFYAEVALPGLSYMVEEVREVTGKRTMYPTGFLAWPRGALEALEEGPNAWNAGCQ